MRSRNRSSPGLAVNSSAKAQRAVAGAPPAAEASADQSTTGMQIRHAILGDVPAVVRLAAEVAAASHLATVLRLDRRRIEETMQALVRGPGGVLLVAIEGGCVVGAAAAGVCRHWWSNDLVLAGMFLIVEPGSAGDGAAQALADSLRLIAEARGATYINWCSVDGLAAEEDGAVYERAGMRPIGRMYELSLRQAGAADQASPIQ